MPRDEPRSLVLTGASSGIGAALAARLAAPGRSMLLIGRNSDRLEAVAARCRVEGAEAAIASVSVTDAPGLAAALVTRDADRPVDLVIANAGVSSGRMSPDAPEPPGQARWITETNVMGMYNTVEPLLPKMIARKRGHIALIGSMAALRPQGDEPSYSAAKAAVHGYGVAMRGWLRAHRIAVTVANPGFVTSPMSARHLGPKPFEISAERAADVIAGAIAARRAHIAFPWQLALLARLDRLLPPLLSDMVERRLAARILPDPEREL
ncbi:MAG: SDR family NAD(P)-dependent oxidoreductase [Pseudomonadota bacterium]